MRWVVEPEGSRLAVRTRATGLLARLAHDLELVTRDLRGTVDLEGDAWSAELTVPVASLRVAGTLHGDRLDAAALSAADRGEIERKLRTDVLRAPDVVARAQGASRERAEVTVSIGVASARSLATFEVGETGAVGRLTVAGRAELSLRALDIPEVRGPLGAFKLKDDVSVLFQLQLAPPAGC